MTLVLGPASGEEYLAFHRAIKSRKDDLRVRTILGSSVGAIFAFFMALGVEDPDLSNFFSSPADPGILHFNNIFDEKPRGLREDQLAAYSAKMTGKMSKIYLEQTKQAIPSFRKIAGPW